MARQFSLPGLEAPNTPLFISALIKSIRLRRTEDAIGWLRKLWAFPSLRHRIARRILISSGEDSISPELMVAVGGWFGGPHRYSYLHAACEVCRICETPSWWALPEGHQMMFSWKRAEWIAKGIQAYSLDGCLPLLDRAMDKKLLLGGQGVFTRISVLPGFSNVRLVDYFGPWVEQSNDARATALYDCWRGVAPILGRDTNICGMLLYLLLGGAVPNILVPHIEHSVVQSLLDRVRSESVGLELPTWANDGIHAHGDGPVDRRFAGVLCNFVGMCNAYEFYGRLDPGDPWLPEFYRLP